MNEIQGNLWKYHDERDPDNFHWIVITTNGDLSSRKQAIMGRGVAYQAKMRYPALARTLGHYIRDNGNKPFFLDKYLMITLPVKHHYDEDASLELIVFSCTYLVNKINTERNAIDKVYMPRPGCGSGKLSWDIVKPAIENILDERFTIVQI